MAQCVNPGLTRRFCLVRTRLVAMLGSRRVCDTSHPRLAQTTPRQGLDRFRRALCGGERHEKENARSDSEFKL